MPGPDPSVSAVRNRPLPAASQIKALSKLGPGACQFIHDHGPWMHRAPDYCGQPAKRGSAYCEKHHRICYHAKLLPWY